MSRFPLFAFLTTLAALAFYTLMAPVPTYRAERLFYKFIMTPAQKVFLDKKDQFNPNRPFAYEKPEVLRDLRDTYQLDQFVDAKSDLNTAISLMHWVRDQFPHGTPKKHPAPQKFDGLALLQNKDPNGYFCGTAAQLFVQAYTSIGGYARRVQLRFTPDDQHSVAEAWINELNKWVVFDVDYDLFYTMNEVPQNALELHTLWANNQIDVVTVHTRESAHNIHQNYLEKIDPTLKLLNYYSFIFYPMRNDWKSRPLPWWHPDANRFQGSLVIQLPTMPVFEDFLWVTTDQKNLSGPPSSF